MFGRRSPEQDDDRAVGFVSGVETTHPDKGTEMFLYELGVDDSARRQGVGRGIALAATRPLARVSEFLYLDRPRRELQLAGRMVEELRRDIGERVQKP